MAKQEPNEAGDDRVECPALEGTGIELYCEREEDKVWIQIRQLGGDDNNPEWRVVRTSFTTKGGDIHFRRKSAE